MKGYKNNHSKTIASNKQQTSPKKKTISAKPKQETKTEKEVPSLSNHDRVIAQRAKKLNMTVELYQMLYPKGFEVN